MNPVTDTHIEIAAEIFRRHGLDFGAAERAGGWTNAVWLNGGGVLRLSTTRGNDRIGREAKLARFLPASVGYPEIVDAGTADGFDWVLTKRIPGRALSAVWRELGWDEKERAVNRIYGMMRDIHAVDIRAIDAISGGAGAGGTANGGASAGAGGTGTNGAGAGGAGSASPLYVRRAWYNPFIKSETMADIERYAASKIFSDRRIRALRDIVERFYRRLDRSERVLNHGDITTDNLMWHDGEVVALLDFEQSAYAPPELDLHSLINLAFIDDDENTNLLVDRSRSQEASRYVAAVSELIAPMLSREGSADLLIGFTVLIRQFFMEGWMAEHGGSPEQSSDYNKICSFCDREGGYYADLLNGV